MKTSLLALPLALIAIQFTAKADTDTIPSGTSISVRTNEPIDIPSARLPAAVKALQSARLREEQRVPAHKFTLAAAKFGFRPNRC